MDAVFTAAAKTLPGRLIPVLKDAPLPRGVDADLRKVVRGALDSGLFGAGQGEIFTVLGEGRGKPRVLALAGLGENGKLDLEVLRKAFGSAARALRAEKTLDFGFDLADPFAASLGRKLGLENLARCAAEGWLLGSYRYDELKTFTKQKKRSPRLHLLGAGLGTPERSIAKTACTRAQAIAEGVALARTLANRPGNELYPESLAAEARRIARRARLRVKILGPNDMKRLGMGAILAVAAGSDRPPRLIELEYRPARPKATLVFVGKGVTFDSGGISIKPARGMEEMKFDMAGGAAVLGALLVAARLKPRVRVVGLVPASENLLSGSATRPGDVIRSASGKTIEIINTDAEGRLLLADALHYARNFRPDAVIDLATLTGACVIALGTQVSGLMASDRRLAERVKEAADAAGEPVWELPLRPEFYEAVKSRVGDLRNSAGRNAGAITAGAFLAHFIEGIPWVHLDIAGTAWTHKPSGYNDEGATGVGVRLLAELAERFSKDA